jgi:hypothetical protein
MCVRLELVVCEGPTCSDRGGGAGLREALIDRLAASGSSDRVAVSPTICFGHCQRGPNVLVCPVVPSGTGAWRASWQGAAGPGTMLLHGATAAAVDGLGALLGLLADHDPRGAGEPRET